jgi:hypothetical protein
VAAARDDEYHSGYWTATPAQWHSSSSVLWRSTTVPVARQRRRRQHSSELQASITASKPQGIANKALHYSAAVYKIFCFQCKLLQRGVLQRHDLSCTHHDTGTMPLAVQLIIANVRRQLRQGAQH